MAYAVPLLLRGVVIEQDWLDHGGRRGGATFQAPDLGLPQHLQRLPLANPSAMGELYDLTLDEIVAFLGQLGQRLGLVPVIVLVVEPVDDGVGVSRDGLVGLATHADQGMAELEKAVV